jgi:glycosyltransferase involved in cell wall biosynthesis
MNSLSPLVSVGIPTYNRPDGLLRTLSCISQQTHNRLEIIVSDNCSSTYDVESVVRPFMDADPRIRFYRQQTNIGAWNNFMFVLAQATGEYFMWAADDDEWHLQFIEKCLGHIGPAVSVMSGYSALWRVSGRTEGRAPCPLDPGLGAYENLRLFLSGPVSSLFYGLHRRTSVQWVLSESPFDWWDCYFVARQIAGGGFATFAEDLYTVGIDTTEYVFKPCAPATGRLFCYRPFLQKVGGLVIRSPDFSIRQKLVLLNTVLDWMAVVFEQFERQVQPRRVTLVRQLRRIKNFGIRVTAKVLQAFAT